MKAVITVIGKDQVGIIAKVSNFLAENSVNIVDISQTILQEMFCMIMIVNFEKGDNTIGEISEKLTKMGEEIGVSIHVQRQELFDSMHRI